MSGPSAYGLSSTKAILSLVSVPHWQRGGSVGLAAIVSQRAPQTCSHLERCRQIAGWWLWSLAERTQGDSDHFLLPCLIGKVPRMLSLLLNDRYYKFDVFEGKTLACIALVLFFVQAYGQSALKY